MEGSSLLILSTEENRTVVSLKTTFAGGHTPTGSSGQGDKAWAWGCAAAAGQAEGGDPQEPSPCNPISSRPAFAFPPPRRGCFPLWQMHMCLPTLTFLQHSISSSASPLHQRFTVIWAVPAALLWIPNDRLQ